MLLEVQDFFTPGRELLAGSLTVGTTATPLSSSSQLCRFLVVQAHPDNADYLLVGNSSSQPIVLQPGQSLNIAVRDVALIYVKAASGTATANWLAYR